MFDLKDLLINISNIYRRENRKDLAIIQNTCSDRTKTPFRHLEAETRRVIFILVLYLKLKSPPAFVREAVIMAP